MKPLQLKILAGALIILVLATFSTSFSKISGANEVIVKITDEKGKVVPNEKVYILDFLNPCICKDNKCIQNEITMKTTDNTGEAKFINLPGSPNNFYATIGKFCSDSKPCVAEKCKMINDAVYINFVTDVNGGHEGTIILIKKGPKRIK